ncbi:hypothetical protein K440DRAFT_203255 [Wilcoxina mikolae CBS 423.85]|nr:hypothetical protein K440DRAFT_203255 [Wilcoxina mikolae CBS 423.85]
MRAPTFIPFLLSVSLFGTQIASLPAPQQDSSNNEKIEKFSVSSTTSIPTTTASITPFGNSNGNDPAGKAAEPTTPPPPPPAAAPANGDGLQEPPHSTDPVSVQTITRSDKTIQIATGSYSRPKNAWFCKHRT